MVTFENFSFSELFSIIFVSFLLTINQSIVSLLRKSSGGFFKYLIVCEKSINVSLVKCVVLYKYEMMKQRP